MASLFEFVFNFALCSWHITYVHAKGKIVYVSHSDSHLSCVQNCSLWLIFLTCKYETIYFHSFYLDEKY